MSTVSRRQRLLGIAALLLATSGWGGMFLVSKGVLHHVEPAWFTLIRYSMSAVLFALLVLPRGAAPWRKLRQHAVPLALRGFAGFGIFSIMLLAGLAHSVPSHGAVIMATTPMTTQLLRWALDGVRPTRSTLLVTALSLLGVAIVSGLLFGTAQAGESTLVGDAVAFAGTLGWVWYTRGTTKFPELDVIEYTALTVLASWPLLLAVAVAGTLLGWTHAPSMEGLRLSWQALLYVGVVSSAIAVLAFNYGVRTLGRGHGHGLHQLRAGVGAADERGNGPAARGERGGGHGDGGRGAARSYRPEPQGFRAGPGTDRDQPAEFALVQHPQHPQHPQHLRRRIMSNDTPKPPRPLLFEPLRLGQLQADNRIVIAPMCQYSATDGTPGDWHMIHLGSLALSGAGLLIIEATAVEAEGRISPGDLGLYSDANEEGLARVLQAMRAQSPIQIAMQLGPCRAQGIEPRAVGRRQADSFDRGGQLAILRTLRRAAFAR
jgi:drug/metabolite transporter (DMT)-like permease